MRASWPEVRTSLWIALLGCWLLLAAAPAVSAQAKSASGDPAGPEKSEQGQSSKAEPPVDAVDRWYFNQDLLVGKGQRVHNITCVFCSAQVEGEVSGRMLVLFGNASVTGRIDHTATVVGGNAVFDEQARVLARTLVLFGNVVYETEEVLPGSVYVLGGHASSFGARHSLQRHLTLSPRTISTLALLCFALLLTAGILTRTRRHTA